MFLRIWWRTNETAFLDKNISYYCTPIQVTYSEHFDELYPIDEVKQFNLTSGSSNLFMT